MAGGVHDEDRVIGQGAVQIMPRGHDLFREVLLVEVAAVYPGAFFGDPGTLDQALDHRADVGRVVQVYGHVLGAGEHQVLVGVDEPGQHGVPGQVCCGPALIDQRCQVRHRSQRDDATVFDGHGLAAAVRLLHGDQVGVDDDGALLHGFRLPP